jgi:hypothetical protein
LPAQAQGPPAQAQAAVECDVEPVWARPLTRVIDIGQRHCSNCGGGELKIIAAILARPVVEEILTHPGLDPQPPPRVRAREAGQD